MDLTKLGFIIALLMPFNQVIKTEFLKPEQSKYVPLISIFLGMLFNVVLLQIGEGWRELILNGIIAGLSAVGLFSTTKNLNTDRRFE